MQFDDPFFFPIHSKFVEAKLIVDLYKVKLGMIKEKLGTFQYSFTNS
jgi:hypothetical protein